MPETEKDTKIESTKKSEHPYRQTLLAATLLWVATTTLSWFAPFDAVSAAKYNLTRARGRIIGLEFAVPILIIWLLAVYGATALNHYARAVSKTKEGGAYKLLSQGVYLLVFQMIFSSFVSQFRTYNPTHAKSLAVFSVYESAALALIAFIVLAVGSWRLLDSEKLANKAKQVIVPCVVIVGLVSWFYVKTILGNQFRQIPPQAGSQATFGVSDTLIFATIVPQYVIAWFAGLLATANILIFQVNVSGIIYKKSFRNFALGFSVIVGLSIFLQFFSQAVAYFAKAGLNDILNIIYALLAAIVAGYIFIAVGAKQLLKLETV